MSSLAGKEVEAVTELALLEKPNRSKLIATHVLGERYACARSTDVEPRPLPPRALLRSIYTTRYYGKGRPFGACDEKTSRLMRYFSRYGDLATANFPHCNYCLRMRVITRIRLIDCSGDDLQWMGFLKLRMDRHAHMYNVHVHVCMQARSCKPGVQHIQWLTLV